MTERPSACTTFERLLSLGYSFRLSHVCRHLSDTLYRKMISPVFSCGLKDNRDNQTKETDPFG